MGISNPVHHQLRSLAGAASPALLERAMVAVLSSSTSLESLASRRMLVRLLAQSLGRAFSPDDFGPAPAADQFSRIVARCTERSEASEGTDALAHAVARVTGGEATAEQLRLLCDWWLARHRLPEEDLRRLAQLLKKNSSPDVRAIAHASLQPLPAPLPTHCTDAWSILLFLLRRNALPSGLPPFMVFLEYLAVSLGNETGTQIRAWAEEHARAHGLLAELENCRQQAASATIESSAERRVMFVLLPDGLEQDYWILRVWHQDGTADDVPLLRDDDARVHQHDLGRAIHTRLRQALAARSKVGGLTVEFWLTLSLVNQPVAEWCRLEDEDDQMADYRVIVRSLDRLQSTSSHPSWKKRWTMLVGDESPRALPAGTDQVGEETPSAVPLILSAPPDAAEGRRELKAAIDSGAPAILWHRSDCSSPGFQRSIHNVISRGPLAELPARLGRLQHDEDNPEAEALRDLTLLWDDPTRPLPVLNPLIAPDEVVAQ